MMRKRYSFFSVFCLFFIFPSISFSQEGYYLLGKENLEFRLSVDNDKELNEATDWEEMVDIKNNHFFVSKKVELGAADIEGIFIKKSRWGGDNYEITVHFKKESWNKVRDVTTRLIGKRLGLVRHNKLLNAPVVQDAVEREATISGDVSISEIEWFLNGFILAGKESATDKTAKDNEIDSLIDELKSRDNNVRKTALNKIVRHKNEAVKPLTDLLIRNQDELVRIDAIRCLGMIKSKPSAEALILFFKQIHKMPDEVTDALRDIGKPAVEPLFKSFDNSDYYTRAVILGALNELTGELLTEHKTIEEIKKLYMRAFLNDDSILVRKSALTLLGQSFFMNDDDVKLIIKKALNDENGDIRGIATAILQGE